MKYNKDYKLLIGAHVELKAPNYLLDSFKLTQNYGANSMMFFAGAPQTTKRTSIEKLNIKEFKDLLIQHNFERNNIFVHAPYLINLGSPSDTTRDFGIRFLIDEINRCAEIGVP
jgi:deoxyribonuclease-4